MVEAKGSTNFGPIPQAEKTGHLKIVPNARVTTIEVDRKGRASGVASYVLKGGEQDLLPAGRASCVLCTYVYENTRLLLLSKSKAFPKGLSNNHGQVGRNYISHVYPADRTASSRESLTSIASPGRARSEQATTTVERRQLRPHLGTPTSSGAPFSTRGWRTSRSAHRARPTPPSVPALRHRLEGMAAQERQLGRGRQRPDREPPLRGQLRRPRPDDQGCLGAVGPPRVTFLDLHAQEKARYAFA